MAAGIILVVLGGLYFMCVGLSVFMHFTSSPADSEYPIIGQVIVLFLMVALVLAGKALIDRGRRR